MTEAEALVEGCAAAQAALLEDIADLSDDVARRPSRLPDWTVGHVLTHIARNADSLVWRLEGAAKGALRDQYPGGLAQRSRDIEEGAGRPAVELVRDVSETGRPSSGRSPRSRLRHGMRRRGHRGAWSRTRVTRCCRAGVRWWCITATWD